MILDACAWVGEYPFGRTRHKTAEDILRLMDAAGIDMALVSPLSGAFYRLCSEANEAVAHETGPHRDRLSLAPVLNPCCPGWREDLRQAADEMHARAIRLIPAYHGCGASDERVDEMVRAAGETGLAVIVTLRLEDERGQPPAFQVGAWPAASAVDLAAANPEARVVMSMARHGELAAVAPRIRELANVWVDLAGVQGPTMCVEMLAAALGAERLVFGTGLPLQYALPARLKVEVTDLANEEKKAVLWGNAKLAFGQGATRSDRSSGST